MKAADALWCGCLLAECFAVAAAVRARRSSGARPLLALLVLAVVVDLAVKAGRVFILSADAHPVREAIARIGWPARAWYHCETALVAAWPLAVAWASARVFGSAAPPDASAMSSVTSGGVRALGGNLLGHHPASVTALPRRARHHSTDLLAGLFIGLVIGMAASYPLRPGLTRWLLWAWEAVCVAAAWAGVARGWPGRGGAVETAAIILVACETMVCTCGPFLTDPFTRWWIATAFYCAAFAAVGVVLGRARRPGVS